MMATGAADHTVALWDVSTRTMIGTAATVDTENMTSVDYSADGARLVTANYGGLITLWDVSARSWAEKALAIANRDLSETERVGYLLESEGEPRVRKPGLIAVLPTGLDLELKRGRLKAGKAWQDFERMRQQQRRRLDEAARREEEATAFARSGEYVEALAALDDAIGTYRALKDEWSIVPVKLASALQDRGTHLMEAGHLEEAEVSLSEASDVARTELESERERGRATDRRRPNAQELRAHRIFARSEAHTGLALRLKGEAKNALSHLNLAVALWDDLAKTTSDPEDAHALAWALNNRGVVHEALGELEIASIDHDRAVSLEKECLRRDETTDRLRYLIAALWHTPTSFTALVDRRKRPASTVRLKRTRDGCSVTPAT
jgi:tetratricopeptide (TPR) repeat protein